LALCHISLAPFPWKETWKAHCNIYPPYSAPTASNGNASLCLVLGFWLWVGVRWCCWFHSASFFGYIYQNNTFFLTNNIGTLAQSLRSTNSPFRVEVHGSIPGPSNHFDGMTPHGCSRCCSLSLIISMMTKHLRGCVRSSAACSRQ